MDVLIVEDDKFHSELLGLIINKEGQKVHFARNGDEASELACKTNFQLIFMDISMPIMDGFDATIEIRKDEAKHGKPHATIVAITANNFEDIESRCEDAGMDEYILKPISTKLVSEIVHRIGKETGKVS